MSSAKNSHVAGGHAPVGPALVRQRPPSPAIGSVGRSDSLGAPAGASERATTLLAQKRYFRIGEVAEAVGVEPHVLRYWEREFRAIRPTKSARGQRVYSRADVVLLLRVKELLYGEGYTIAGARKKISGKGAPETSVPAAPRAGEPSPAQGPAGLSPDAIPTAVVEARLGSPPSLSTSPQSGERASAAPSLAHAMPRSDHADAIEDALGPPVGDAETAFAAAVACSNAARPREPQRHLDPNVALRLGKIRAELEAFLSELGGA